MNVAQSSAHIFDRVQHVRSDDEIERLRFRVSAPRKFLEIKNLELHFRKCRQLLRRAGEKCGPGDIAECVGMQVALQEWQKTCEANPPVFPLRFPGLRRPRPSGRPARGGAQRCANGCEPVTGEGVRQP